MDEKKTLARLGRVCAFVADRRADRYLLECSSGGKDARGDAQKGDGILTLDAREESDYFAPMNQPDLSFPLFLIFGALAVVFVILTAVVVYVAKMQSDIRIVRELIAAFMEHKVAGTVAENKLASLVEKANQTAK